MSNIIEKLTFAQNTLTQEDLVVVAVSMQEESLHNKKALLESELKQVTEKRAENSSKIFRNREAVLNLINSRAEEKADYKAFEDFLSAAMKTNPNYKKVTCDKVSNIACIPQNSYSFTLDQSVAERLITKKIDTQLEVVINTQLNFSYVIGSGQNRSIQNVNFVCGSVDCEFSDLISEEELQGFQKIHEDLEKEGIEIAAKINELQVEISNIVLNLNQMQRMERNAKAKLITQKLMQEEGGQEFLETIK
jgi:hypothetical protein